MITDFEKCVEMAQERLRQIITAANKADSKEMESLICSSLAVELPTKTSWKGPLNGRLVIGKYEFTINEMIEPDARVTDRFCLFGPMPNLDMPEEEFENVQEQLDYLCITNVVYWQYGPFSYQDRQIAEQKAIELLTKNKLI